MLLFFQLYFVFVLLDMRVRVVINVEIIKALIYQNDKRIIWELYEALFQCKYQTGTESGFVSKLDPSRANNAIRVLDIIVCLETYLSKYDYMQG